MTRLFLVTALIVLSVGAAIAVEPKTCREAYAACVKPFGRICDGGCVATCRLRVNGCMKTGAFSLSAPRLLLQNLKRY